ncbi:MAG TPA: hypothetical protein VK750_07380 [Cytophagaceae bacterium]|jgi:hypothetical protein|nr:hypothetical protein [Cytophagaceae bacterium]
MATNDIESFFRLKIKRELGKCTSTSYPNFYNLIKTKGGYLKAEEMVIQYAIKNNLPISSAIAQLESELG